MSLTSFGVAFLLYIFFDKLLHKNLNNGVFCLVHYFKSYHLYF